MLRSLTAVSLILVPAAPAFAAVYSARLESPSTQRLITPDMSWYCTGDGCRGSTAESRPVVLCESLAKRAGHVDSFAVDGRAFTAAELATCNGAIRRKNRAFAAK